MIEDIIENLKDIGFNNPRFINGSFFCDKTAYLEVANKLKLKHPLLVQAFVDPYFEFDNGHLFFSLKKEIYENKRLSKLVYSAKSKIKNLIGANQNDKKLYKVFNQASFIRRNDGKYYLYRDELEAPYKYIFKCNITFLAQSRVETKCYQPSNELVSQNDIIQFIESLDLGKELKVIELIYSDQNSFGSIDNQMNFMKHISYTELSGNESFVFKYNREYFDQIKFNNTVKIVKDQIHFDDVNGVIITNKLSEDIRSNLKVKSNKESLNQINELTKATLGFYPGKICHQEDATGNHRFLILEDKGQYCEGLMLTSKPYWGEKTRKATLEELFFLDWDIRKLKKRNYLTKTRVYKDNLVDLELVFPEDRLKALVKEYIGG